MLQTLLLQCPPELRGDLGHVLLLALSCLFKPLVEPFGLLLAHCLDRAIDAAISFKQLLVVAGVELVGGSKASEDSTCVVSNSVVPTCFAAGSDPKVISESSEVSIFVFTFAIFTAAANVTFLRV